MLIASVDNKSLQGEDHEYSQHGKYQQGFSDTYHNVLHRPTRVVSKRNILRLNQSEQLGLFWPPALRCGFRECTFRDWAAFLCVAWRATAALRCGMTLLAEVL